jgi:hypothetical protein
LAIAVVISITRKAQKKDVCRDTAPFFMGILVSSAVNICEGKSFSLLVSSHSGKE